MLSVARLEKNFWAEAMMTVSYLINKSSTIALVYKTPKDVWSSKKPSLSHLRIFGCEAFVYILRQQRTKFDFKA